MEQWEKDRRCPVCTAPLPDKIGRAGKGTSGWTMGHVHRHREPSAYGTHSMRRTKLAQIYTKRGNLRAVQLLGYVKIDSTVRYRGVELDDALTISEAIDL